MHCRQIFATRKKTLRKCCEKTRDANTRACEPQNDQETAYRDACSSPLKNRLWGYALSTQESLGLFDCNCMPVSLFGDLL